MVIKWTRLARNDLLKFYQNAHPYTEDNVKKYIEELIQYTKILKDFPNLGKNIFYIKDFEIKQLLFKKHRIIYYIQETKIIILTIIHTSRNINRILKTLKKIIKNR